MIRRLWAPVFVATTIAASLAAAAALSAYILVYADISSYSRAAYFVLFLSLFYCSFAYQLNRFGTAMRWAGYRPEPAGARLAPDPEAPPVTILIPTFREERRVLRMTVLSAALARYTRRRIVVLIDDPPDSRSVVDSRAVVEEVRALLATPMRELGEERDAFLARLGAGDVDLAAETQHASALYLGAADWLAALAAELGRQVSPAFEHVDRFAVDRVILEAAGHYRAEADRLATAAPTPARLKAEYARLATLFCADIGSFERKRFVNLSHAANKAMNLNSYIGLMGQGYREVEGHVGRALVKAEPAEATLVVPTSTYVLTLDADSVVLGDYIVELVQAMERDPTLGVAQTPYLTFPRSTSAVERIAGATTDIQHLVHQGSSFYDAAYWVGANALIRVAALDSIHSVETEAGRPVDVFIQDLTVIEDTGSTIDLLGAGWKVHNHLRPLAYSATPADFGSLAIQRKRWSNGGLIIFPTLLGQYLRSGMPVRRALEFWLRSHYLLSPLIGNGAVFLLMIMASSDARHMVWTPLAMVPYFLLYGLDLRRIGYRFADLFAVSALNLILLPIGFAGVLASLRQMLTGRKAPFSRTPKVAGRTATGAGYILFNLAMLVLMARYLVDGVLAGDLLASLVPAVNLTLYIYGIDRFIGLRAGAADLALAARLALSSGAGVQRSRPMAGPALAGIRLALASLVALTAMLTPTSFGSADSNGVPLSGVSLSEAAGMSAGSGAWLPVDGQRMHFSDDWKFYDQALRSGDGTGSGPSGSSVTNVE